MPGKLSYREGLGRNFRDGSAFIRFLMTQKIVLKIKIKQLLPGGNQYPVAYVFSYIFENRSF